MDNVSSTLISFVWLSEVTTLISSKLITAGTCVSPSSGHVIITSTSSPNNLIEIQAFPDSNDIIGLKDLYLTFDVSNSAINMVKDVIASGEDVSGVVFSRDYYTSSYSNGNLERK